MFSNGDNEQVEYEERGCAQVARSCLPSHGRFVIEQEFDAIHYLEQLKRDLERLRSRRGNVAKVVRTATGREIRVLNRLGEDLKNACAGVDTFDRVEIGGHVWSRLEQHQFHPYLRAFFDRYLGVRQTLLHVIEHGRREEVAEFISHMAGRLLEDFEDPIIKAQVKALRARSCKKFERALAYARGWFTMCSRPLLLRVDLYIREDGTRWGYSEEAWKAFDFFCKALSRGKIIGHTLGWMAARDDGTVRGVHYHVIVALDGHDHRAGVYFTRKLGEFWKSNCVGNKAIATYYNCFGKRDRLRYPAIGVVKASNPRGLMGTYFAIRYLCKEEQIISATGTQQRNFRRGVDRKPAGGMGAPRRTDPDRSLVRTILSTRFDAKALRKDMYVARNHGTAASQLSGKLGGGWVSTDNENVGE